MDKTIKFYILLLVLLVASIVFIEGNHPKPINWTPTYSLKDKIPFGLYVFDNEINTLLKKQKITQFSTSPYEYFKDKVSYDTLSTKFNVKGTLLNINKENNFDKQSIKKIFSFVRKGNNVFLSANQFPKKLLDSLNIKIKSEFKYNDSIYNWVANKKLGNTKYKITEGLGNHYFSEIDTINSTVLGYQSGASTRVNFIKIKYKSGYFYLHTQPTAFSNFHLLKSNHYQYAEKVLSYIPKGNVFWCVENQTGEKISTSPMRYILSQPSLQWAWYIFLVGMLVFMVFNAKRKQRIVPIIKPITNTTIDFTKTIGNLYYQEGDHNNIIDKKIIYFLEKIRNDYLIETKKLDESFLNKLHLKSGKNYEDLKNVIYLINNYRKNNYISIEDDLVKINNAIEKVIN